MRASYVFFALFRFLLPPTIISLLYLYLYPAILGCSFPEAKRAEAACSIPGQQKAAVLGDKAPFRLLALADPQLEGDTSLPDPNAPLLPSLERLLEDVNHGGLNALSDSLVLAATALVQEDVPRLVRIYQKKLDLLGNDYYLAHVYRSVSWWTQPTHVVVLGDLLGSQWIGAEEFKRRSDRFWNRVFRGAKKVPDSITHHSTLGEALGEDDTWKTRIIAVAGNHDIGYAGDINAARIERFEQTYGPVNWETSFGTPNPDGETIGAGLGQAYDQHPELRLVVLNSMNLDSPAWDQDHQKRSLDFLHDHVLHPSLAPTGRSTTVLLTHIPLHKPAGVCVDSPYFSYYPAHYGGGVREQNHLSKEISEQILDGLLGADANGSSEFAGQAIILNGHDHEGCDTYHYQYHSRACMSICARERSEPAKSECEADCGVWPWESEKYRFARPLINDPGTKGFREITVRSMMGSYGGNAGLLSAWFDYDLGEWNFEYTTCVLGVQHIWWAIHVLALVECLLGLGAVGAWVVEGLLDEYWAVKMARAPEEVREAYARECAEGRVKESLIKSSGKQKTQ